MPAKFSELDVHDFIYQQGMAALTSDLTSIEEEIPSLTDEDASLLEDDIPFELWKIIKAKATEKIERLHELVRYGTFIGSKINLPTDKTRPMQLDLLGLHDDGIFVLELKVDKSAERNAFSELFAYSNYIADIFALSGHRDITNVLVSSLDAKITRHAFLYDLLIADRNIIVYTPSFSDGSLQSLSLNPYFPSDDDFQKFTNRLLSHDAISCVVASFHDIPDWIDSGEISEAPPDYTRKFLKEVSSYTAQLMEEERLHGFCFIRKPWAEIPMYYRNSLIICAVDPFAIEDFDLSNEILSQIDEEHHSSFFENPRSGFSGRLIRIAHRALRDSLKHGQRCEVELPLWSQMVVSMVEVVFTHNMGFRPTGLFRDAYVSYIDSLYEQNQIAGTTVHDVSVLQIEEITNWMRAWTFMEGCGFSGINADEGGEGDEDDEPPAQ